DTVRTDLRTDRKANRAGVMEALDAMAATRPQDTAVLFLSGHARTVGSEWYFLPQELADLADEREVVRVGISGDALAEALIRVPARRILVIVDSCQAGAVLAPFEVFGQRRALHALKRRAGVVVIAATRADQLALEYGLLGHGLLTFSLLEGLQEGARGRLRADTAPADGRLTAAEIKSYAETRAPALAAELDDELAAMVGGRGDFSSTVPVTPVGLVLGANFAVAR
ncbi:MAG: hypothetical protein AAF074_24480, partial [Pseudomonadota bacterium]